jgi:hypothetical protein
LSVRATARMAGPSDQNTAGGGIPRGAGLQGCIDALVSNTGPSVRNSPVGFFSEEPGCRVE